MRQLRHPPLFQISAGVRFAANYAKSAIHKKPRVVVVGSGWGGARFLRDINPELVEITVLSQRNHMLFTPLLPQTTTGTLEFRSICEPLVNIQPALRSDPHKFYRTMVFDVDFENKEVQCVTVGVLDAGEKPPVNTFKVSYDYLVMTHGARPNTFNIPGVEEYAFFLREISEARGIRRRLGQNMLVAALPSTTTEEARRLLHVVVVGGGPTGVEFATDISDFLKKDIRKHATHLADEFRVTLVEAGEVLGTFDQALQQYSASRLLRSGIKIKQGVVAEVTANTVSLTDGTELECGLVVWSTGVGPSALNKSLEVDKNRQGRLMIDEHLQMMKNGKSVDSCFALGDCAADRNNPLPTLAAVASRQGCWLAKILNKSLKTHQNVSNMYPAFEYKHAGSMVSLPGSTAAVALQIPRFFKWDLRGFYAFVVWRSAYFTMLGSFRSRAYVAMNWLGSTIWGRDMTYIAEISEAKMWKNLASEGATKEQARLKLLREARKQAVTEAASTPPAQTTSTESAKCSQSATIVKAN